MAYIAIRFIDGKVHIVIVWEVVKRATQTYLWDGSFGLLEWWNCIACLNTLLTITKTWLKPGRVDPNRTAKLIFVVWRRCLCFIAMYLVASFAKKKSNKPAQFFGLWRFVAGWGFIFYILCHPMFGCFFIQSFLNNS